MKSFVGKVLGASGVGVLLILVGVLAAGTVACGKGSLEKGLSGPVPATPQELMAELQTEKEKIDRVSDDMMKRIDAFNQSRGPGEKKLQFSEIFYSDLSPEQRDVLDQLLAEEKTPTYKNLLAQMIEDRKTLQNLQEQVMKLEQQLPDKFAIAHKGDTHYKLAHEFLIGEGVDEQKAKDLLNQIDLNEDLIAGFKVWYNYDKEKDTFKTYVTQGEAGQTPLAVKRAVKRKLIGERDVAMAKAVALEQTRTALQQDVARLETDINTLEDRRSSLEVNVADLEGRNSELQVRGDRYEADLGSKQNSVFYHAANSKTLADQGVLSKFLKNLKDVKGVSFEESVDLRQARSISFSPEAYGLKSIKDLEILPGVYQEGRDYSVQVAEDGRNATVVFNDPEIFKQQRVLISLKGEI